MRVAEAVVDVLEAVEVEEEDGEVVAGVPLGPLDGEPQVVREEGAVREARQRVVEGGVAEVLLARL